MSRSVGVLAGVWLERGENSTDPNQESSTRSHRTTGCAVEVPLTGPTDQVEDQPDTGKVRR